MMEGNLQDEENASSPRHEMEDEIHRGSDSDEDNDSEVGRSDDVKSGRSRYSEEDVKSVGEAHDSDAESGRKSDSEGEREQDVAAKSGGSDAESGHSSDSDGEGEKDVAAENVGSDAESGHSSDSDGEGEKDVAAENVGSDAESGHSSDSEGEGEKDVTAKSDSEAPDSDVESGRKSDSEGEREKGVAAKSDGEASQSEEVQDDAANSKSDDEGSIKSDSEVEEEKVGVTENGGQSEASSSDSEDDVVVQESVKDELSHKGNSSQGGSDREDHKEHSTESPTTGPNNDDNTDDDSSEASESDHEEESKVGELIADIFGESDQDEEFEGFGDEDVAAAKRKKEEKRKKQRKQQRVLSESEVEQEKDEIEAVVSSTPQEVQDEEKQVEDSDDDDMSKAHIVYDFDLMLQKKKEESGRRRKFRNVDIINDSDDLIADLLNQMKTAATEDRDLNKRRVAATKKLKMLPLVVSQLKKLDLKVAFLDQGVLNIMNEWLLPLPDRSLPHLQIRTNLLRLLAEFPPIDQSVLKSSGIGRAVMYLYKHPKESRENKEKAGKLISEWSRPIFNLNTNFSSMSKEEREHRDFEHMPKKRKLRLESGEETSEDIGSAMAGDDRALKPGEKGWIGRARVPLPSTRDYVVRPKWNVDLEFNKSGGRKSLTRLDKHIRSLKERKKQNKLQRAVSISIEGRKMSL